MTNIDQEVSTNEEAVDGTFGVTSTDSGTKQQTFIKIKEYGFFPQRIIRKIQIYLPKISLLFNFLKQLLLKIRSSWLLQPSLQKLCDVRILCKKLAEFPDLSSQTSEVFEWRKSPNKKLKQNVVVLTLVHASPEAKSVFQICLLLHHHGGTNCQFPLYRRTIRVGRADNSYFNFLSFVVSIVFAEKKQVLCTRKRWRKNDVKIFCFLSDRHEMNERES